MQPLVAPSDPSRMEAALGVVGSNAASEVQDSAQTFAQVYDATFPFVWRSARRLGVEDAALDDVVQETYVVVHRRLAEFERRSSIKTWIFGIVVRVARDHRRTTRRKSPQARAGADAIDPETLSANDASGPQERAARSEAVRVLYNILDELEDDRREVFVLAELEQMSAPEIAEALEMNVNTVYTRLRAARADFESGVARHRARDDWRAR